MSDSEMDKVHGGLNGFGIERAAIAGNGAVINAGNGIAHTGNAQNPGPFTPGFGVCTANRPTCP
jgi:hypothetical protein